MRSGLTGFTEEQLLLVAQGQYVGGIDSGMTRVMPKLAYGKNCLLEVLKWVK